VDGQRHDEGWLDAAGGIFEGSRGEFLPPQLNPNAYWMRYEPTRLMEYFVGKRSELQSVQWLQHYANTQPAAAWPAAGG
jgi:hypothetical protein